jgi:hypothetical protein
MKFKTGYTVKVKEGKFAGTKDFVLGCFERGEYGNFNLGANMYCINSLPSIKDETLGLPYVYFDEESLVFCRQLLIEKI